MTEDDKEANSDSSQDKRKRISLKLPEEFRKAFEVEAKKRGVQPAELAKVWLYETMKEKLAAEN